MECMPRPCVLPVEAVLWGCSLNNSQKTVLRENLYITRDKAMNLSPPEVVAFA